MTLRSRVASRLGYDPFGADEGMFVSAIVRREGKPLRGDLEFTDESGKPAGKKTLRSATGDCDSLLSAMAVAISIAIDPLRLTQPETRSAPPEVPSGPRQPEPARVDPPTSEKSDPWLLRVVLGAGAGVGVVPSATPVLSFGAGARHRALSLDLVGHYYFSESTSASLTPSTGTATTAPRVSGSLVSGSLLPCGHVGAFAACAVLQVGRFEGEGQGVDLPKKARGTFAALGARLAGEFPIGKSVSFFAGANLMVPMASVGLNLGGVRAWETGTLTATLDAGLLLGLPL